MIKKMLFLTLALVAFSVPADVVIPLTQDVAAAIGVQKPTDAIKYFYAKCDTLPETGKTIELAANKNTQLSIKEVKSFEVTAFEAAFAKKQNVAVFFVAPTDENSFVLQVTFNATATQPDGKTKQPTWTDVRIYGLSETCPKAVEAFVKTYFSRSYDSWIKGAGVTTGVLGLSWLVLSKSSKAINMRRPLRKALKKSYEYDDNLSLCQNAKLAFLFHGIGNADTFITVDELKDCTSLDCPKKTPHKTFEGALDRDRKNSIFIIDSTVYSADREFFYENRESIVGHVLILNDTANEKKSPRNSTLWFGNIGFYETAGDQTSPFTRIGFMDGRKSSSIKKTLTSDHTEFMNIWAEYTEWLIPVRIS